MHEGKRLEVFCLSVGERFLKRGGPTFKEVS